jgi:alanyl-tRNA synthetase
LAKKSLATHLMHEALRSILGNAEQKDLGKPKKLHVLIFSAFC